MVLVGEPPGEDDGDDAVGADDLRGEEGAVDEPEQDHPQAAAPHEATGIDGRLLPGLVELSRRRRPEPAGQLLAVGVDARCHAPVDHGGQPEAEEQCEQRVGALVDEQGTYEGPGPVGGRWRTALGACHPEPHIGQGDEQQHEAAGDVGGGVAQAAGTSE